MKPQAVTVWDLPLRLFHWSWAAAFAAAWLTRGDRWLYFHLLAGYLFGALLLFRLAWGFTGTREARFSAFTYPAREARAYLRQIVGGTPPRHLGHNPPGSWAIWLMLMLGLMLFLSGVATLGTEERQGPLSGFLDFAWGERLHEVHELLAWILLGVVGLHLLGVAVESRIHRENLVAAMITGRKPLRSKPLPDVPRRGGIAIALALGLSSFGMAWSWPWWAADDAKPFLPFPGPPLTRNELWDEECGTCHLAYHPSLLPANEWKALFGAQKDHFGEDLALDAPVLAELLAHAVTHAAETAPTEAAWKLYRNAAQEPGSPRITQNPYWRNKHASIPEALWQSPQVHGRYNCDACHLDATQGWFADSAMRLPTDIDQPQSQGEQP